MKNGLLGQWVVAVLLAIVVALWVALVAVVVRVRMRTTPGGRRAGAPGGASTEGPASV